MIIQQKIGNINTTGFNNKTIDRLPLQWYETKKRILRKKTQSGKEVSLKFLNENPSLTEGDILYEDEQTIIAVSVLSCNAIVIKPKDIFEASSVCYEIGNKHLPLFFQDNELLTPFDKPLFRLLSAQGYDVKQEERKLVQPLKTTVSPHLHNSNETLFSKIMKLTATNE